MILNQNGLIVEKHLLKLQSMFENETIRVFQIMSNHIHLIYGIFASNDPFHLNNNNTDDNQRSKMTLSKRMQSFKRSVSIEVNLQLNGGFEWQRSFYDHVIRNKESYENIRQYILDNPLNWKEDKDNPDNFT